MHNLARLVEEHDALADAARTLIALATEECGRPAEAHRELTHFREELDAHLAAEADFMYADEMRKDPTRLDTEIIAFEQEFADLKNNWADYLAQWSLEAITADWAGFASATTMMMHRLLERIEAENAVLYPLALQHGRIRLRAA